MFCVTSQAHVCVCVSVTVVQCPVTLPQTLPVMCYHNLCHSRTTERHACPAHLHTPCHPQRSFAKWKMPRRCSFSSIGPINQLRYLFLHNLRLDNVPCFYWHVAYFVILKLFSTTHNACQLPSNSFCKSCSQGASSLYL